jgi:carboxyl-terminal processing protease
LHVAEQVAQGFARPVSRTDLITAALTGWYEAAQVPVPAKLRERVEGAVKEHELTQLVVPVAAWAGVDGERFATHGPLQRLLAQTFRELSASPFWRDQNTTLVGCQAMTRVLDEHSRVISSEELRRASVPEMVYGTGIDLADNQGVGPLRVAAVLPGGPAQQAGVRPGDEITHIDGESVKGMTSAVAQGKLNDAERWVEVKVVGGAFVPQNVDTPDTPVRLTLRSGVGEPRELTLKRQMFRPETVLGVVRRDDNTWDYWCDRERKLAHVRLARLGNGSAQELADVVAVLRKRDVRGLVLDLRWCPGGFLKEALGVAEMFLGDGVTATVQTRGTVTDTYRSTKEEGKLTELPLVVLVNGETAGGAESIAAALQDHRRAAVAGQRTRGKASIQTVLALPVADGHLKLTTGTFVRPSGKNLHRFPDSRPADDWGVRPDARLEVRVSPDLDRQVREGWQAKTLRPGPACEALPLDDLRADPALQAALEALRVSAP